MIKIPFFSITVMSLSSMVPKWTYGMLPHTQKHISNFRTHKLSSGFKSDEEGEQATHSVISEAFSGSPWLY